MVSCTRMLRKKAVVVSLLCATLVLLYWPLSGIYEVKRVIKIYKYYTSSSMPNGLFPDENPFSDRIIEQTKFVPANQTKTKRILLYHHKGKDEWLPCSPAGGEAFRGCPVQDCVFTTDRREAATADALFFKEMGLDPNVPRPSNQVWIFFSLESPAFNHRDRNFLYNWTATYRFDSDIRMPYGKWLYYNDSVTSLPQNKNYAEGKTKKVAWFVSNCAAQNLRLEYAKELQKYIEVDIYGGCGTKTCPRSEEKKCFELLRDSYKFYLAFENSNCKDYITEKFFKNGLRYNVIPIAMGARPEDYARLAPRGSYILVEDFPSPKHLAEYLHTLDKDDDLYNAYFRWKGTGSFLDDTFCCRLCSMLHGNFPHRVYEDFNEWFAGPGTCTKTFWRKDIHI